jgi:hypothetical protein
MKPTEVLIQLVNTVEAPVVVQFELCQPVKWLGKC